MATTNAVAFLDLGDGDYLSVAGTVGNTLADAIVPLDRAAQGTTPPGPYASATADDANPVRSVSDTRAAALSSAIVDILPTIGGSLLSYPTPSVGNSQVMASDVVTAIPNPEPASLLLLGSGMLIALRRYRGRRE